MNKKIPKLLLITLCIPLAGGCFHPSITAVNLNDRSAPEGIPYYLPKPYIIISKNIRYIPTPTIGLTQTASIPNMFDPGTQKSGAGNGANPGSTNRPTSSGGSSNILESANVPANQNNSAPAGSPATPVYNGQVLGPASITVVPSAPLPDDLTPQTFYTYQIVYLPDLTQKYGLRVKGGVGEMRATLNMVNGWMFTGPGPVYFKDSNTADITAANWNGADSALESAAKIVSTIYGVPNVSGITGSSNQLQSAAVPSGMQEIENYARIWIYEGNLSADGKSMTWKLLSSSDAPTATITREYLADMALKSGAAGPGGTQASGQPKDSFPDITKQVNALISDAGINDLNALRTSQSGAAYLTTVNRTLTTDETQKLAAGLNALKVELSVQQ